MNNTTDDSKIWGVSLRAWIVSLLVGTACGIYIIDAVTKAYMRIAGKSDAEFTIGEPLYTLSIMVVTFYFGNSRKKEAGANEATADGGNTTVITK